MNEPIFIMSEVRSGSTLLRVLLDTHPAICSPGEMWLGLLCDHLFHAVATTLGQVVYGQSVEARTELCLAETRRIVDGILQTYCALKGKRRWCEKSPTNLLSVAKLRAVFPDGRYICLYRHCLDVVHSSMARCVDFGPVSLEYRDKYGGCVLPAFIERWCDRTDDLLALEAAAAGTSQRVKYEDLVADPAGCLRKILAFIGEEWRPDLIERAFASPHDHGVGDPKIASTSTVCGDRVGGGGRLDLSAVPPALLDRMRRTLALLGYDELPEVAAPAPPPSRPVHTTVAAIVDELFRQRLERHRLWLRAPRLDIGIIVRGEGGGAWTLQFGPSGACLGPAAGPSAVTLAIESTDLLDAANGRLTLGELRTRVALEGASLDFPLLEGLVHVLFGDDLRVEGNHAEARPFAAYRRSFFPAVGTRLHLENR